MRNLQAYPPYFSRKFKVVMKPEVTNGPELHNFKCTFLGSRRGPLYMAWSRKPTGLHPRDKSVHFRLRYHDTTRGNRVFFWSDGRLAKLAYDTFYVLQFSRWSDWVCHDGNSCILCISAKNAGYPSPNYPGSCNMQGRTCYADPQVLYDDWYNETKYPPCIY